MKAQAMFRAAAGLCFGLAAPLLMIHAQQSEQSPASVVPAPEAHKKFQRPPRPGVSTPGVKRDMASIAPASVFTLGGAPDWQVLTEDAVWVSNGPLSSIHRLDVKTNQVAATIAVGKRPCSGLAAGFGSIWVPNCGDKTVSRVDMKTNTVVATIAATPAESEGGIAASEDAVWLVTDKEGKLSRIDPNTNAVTAMVDVPPGSASVLYGDGAIWVTTPAKNLLTRVDPKANKVTDTIEVGPGPRFQTFGAGSVWTLNQGDGTISRVDTKTRKVLTTVEVGIPGNGGEIAFGLGHVWATVFQIPISEIDPETNKVTRQWFGPGGDSIRAGHGAVWLSDLRGHSLSRIDPAQLK
jgi:YVTN family beta-propeller protein